MVGSSFGPMVGKSFGLLVSPDDGASLPLALAKRALKNSNICGDEMNSTCRSSGSSEMKTFLVSFAITKTKIDDIMIDKSS